MLDISKDYTIFDNTETLYIQRKGDPNVNYADGIVTVNRIEEEIQYCLIRQVSERLLGTVRQIFERGKSIANDSINTVDTVIEIPQDQIDEIEIGDEIIQRVNDEIKSHWMILAIDYSTLQTRYRVACRRM